MAPQIRSDLIHSFYFIYIFFQVAFQLRIIRQLNILLVGSQAQRYIEC